MNVWIFWRLLQRSVEWTRHHFFQHEMWWLWRKFRAPFSLNWRTKQEISVKTKAHKKFIRHYSLGHTPLKCKVASALICSLQDNAHVCEKWWHTDWNFSVFFLGSKCNFTWHHYYHGVVGGTLLCHATSVFLSSSSFSACSYCVLFASWPSALSERWYNHNQIVRKSKLVIWNSAHSRTHRENTQRRDEMQYVSVMSVCFFMFFWRCFCFARA